MISYNLIKNEQLRKLIMISESIQSLPEKEIQDMVERAAALPVKGQEAMIAALKEEQEKVAAAKLAKGITPEMEQAELTEKIQQIKIIKKNMLGDVRKEHERVEAVATTAKAEELLNGL